MGGKHRYSNLVFCTLLLLGNRFHYKTKTPNHVRQFHHFSQFCLDVL
jgi:hypothetical protein